MSEQLEQDRKLAEIVINDPDAAPEVCHTPEERRVMYDAISQDKKTPALAIFAEIPVDVEAEIRSAFVADPEHWWRASGFRLWGMAVRNLLRSRGFDSDYFQVHNLDDIYVLLVEEALKLR